MQTSRRTIYANACNGFAFPHDDVCYFMSTHGHSRSFGYFRIDAMPHSGILRLLRGEPIRVVDATQHDKPLTDGLRYGLTTFALVFNRALRRREVSVAPWQTPHMQAAAWSATHRPLVNRIRRFAAVVGDSGPILIGDGQLIEVECHQRFGMDDKPDLLREAIAS